MKKLIKEGVEYEVGDYDGRTPIHLAASEGHLKIVKYMIEKAKLKHFDPIDRWGNTPYDDAVRGGFEELSNYLKSLKDKRDEGENQTPN